MCGIAGIFHADGSPVSRAVIRSMTEALVHRGPDGVGTWDGQGAALGHRRLAILDPSPRGAQPMTSKNGDWVVAFNGCIYNFQELREELRGLGHVFVSDTDTEVIAEGLAAWGPEVFRRFNGMFAVAAYSQRRREMILSRDRFGVKPLYYWFRGGRLVFGSEVKAIMRHPDFRVELNT